MSLPESLSPTGAGALEAIVRAPSETLIATDFDGTLAPIVEDPEQAYADPNAVAALGRLGEHVGAVVVITGRPVHGSSTRPVPRGRRLAVDDRVGPVRRRALECGGQRVSDPARSSADPRGGRGTAEDLGLLDVADARIEDKSRAIAVHTRSLPDPKAALAKLEGLQVSRHGCASYGAGGVGTGQECAGTEARAQRGAVLEGIGRVQGWRRMVRSSAWLCGGFLFAHGRRRPVC